MNEKIMKPLSSNDALCKPNQKTAYIRSHTVHWQNPAPGYYYLEYSYNRRDWYQLNGGNAIALPAEGLLLIPELEQHEPDGADITIEQLQDLQRIYGAPEPVYLSEIEDISQTIKQNNGVRPSHIEVQYTNGAKEIRPLIWNGTAAAISAPSYPSPLIRHRADPYICRHTDGTYYFMGSYTDAGHNLDGRYQYLYLIIRSAATIAGLADQSGEYKEQIIWHREAINNGSGSPHLWAPELHFIHGKWYVYYTTTISEESSWRMRPHCLECQGDDPMTGRWIERGPVTTTVAGDIAFTDFSLDHTYFNHHGRDYLVWAQKTNNISDIFIAELANPWTICTPAVLLTHPEYNWEQHGFAVNEGASVIKHGGKIFMTFSASGTDATYCMGLLTADEDDDLLNPAAWVKCPHPVFQSSRQTSCYGPGHNSFVRSEDDVDDLIVYHARSDARYLGEEDYQPLYDAGRNAYIGKVFWNPDGTPSFSIPGAAITDNPENLLIQPE